jgi:hypothetical protein
MRAILIKDTRVTENIDLPSAAATQDKKTLVERNRTHMGGTREAKSLPRGTIGCPNPTLQVATAKKDGILLLEGVFTLLSLCRGC